MSDNILESLKQDMVEQERLFNEVRQQMVDLANEYNKKLKDYSEQVATLNNTIAELEAEGNRELKKLQEQQEYYRGAYTGLYNQYVKFGGILTNDLNSNNDNNKKEIDKNTVGEKESKSTKKQPTKKNVGTKKNDLSEEELKKIQAITSNVVGNVKEEDIPDYLKDEYKNK